jgi:glyoxylase-like metal-dependent hydrolase (beta-lactamase superfamily II)
MVTQATEDYVATRRIGDATVMLINDGIFDAIPLIPWMDAPAAAVRHAVPEADASGAIGQSGMIVAHVRIGHASILIDPGVGELDLRSWLVTELKLRRTPGVQAGLAASGIQPEQITHVLITHAHDDHFLGATVRRDGQYIPRYPQARYVIGRADWVGNPAREDPTSEVALRLGALDRLGVLDVVDGDDEIVPGVTMIPAPGESPGHSIVHVASAGDHFYYLGDLFHHTCEVAHLDWVMTHRDTAAMIASRQRLITDAVPRSATLVFTHHIFPGWGHIVSTDTGYRWDAV